MRRGEVWWANLAPPLNRRPVLLLSRSTAYRSRTLVTVAPITRTIRHISAEVLLDERDGMPTQCVVNLDNVLTVEKELLDRQITTLSEEKMHLVAWAIVFALDLERDL